WAITPASAAPFAYIPNADSGTLSVLDVAASTVIATVHMGATPLFVAIHPHEPRVYVTNRGDATVSVIDAVTTSVLTTIPTGTRPTGVAINPAGTRLYVANIADQPACTSPSCPGYVSVIDATTYATLATVQVGVNIHSVAVHPDGSRFYAS